MSNQHTPWQPGTSDAPLPPLVPIQQVIFHPKDDSSLKLYLESYQTYGPIFRIARQDRPLTVLAGPDANVFVARYGTEILSEKAFWQQYDQEYGVQEVGREGDANRQRRALLSRSYSRGRILDRLSSLVQMTREHASSWQPGERITFYPWLQELVAEQLGQLLTHYGPGEYVRDLDTFLSTAVGATMTTSQEKSALQAPDYLRAKERVFELGRAVVAAHRAALSSGRQPDLVDDMIGAAARTGHATPDDQLALGALGPFLAGMHTVTTAFCYLFCALHNHPDALARVVTELDAILTQGELTWEALKTMQSLNGAMMEALRLFPVSLGHSCQAIQPFTFAGYRVEVGTDVFVAMTVSHFLPELFPSPMTFDIDRYTPPRNEHRKPGAYAPFGLGDHACLGAGIAEAQLMSIAATLLFLYQFELDPPDYVIHPLEVPRASVRDHFVLRVVAARHGRPESAQK